jgi:membrane protease YdiL (CAAX protease family)
MQDRVNENALSPEQLQQHPELTLLLMLFSGLILALLAGSISLWLVTLGRMRRGETVLRVEPWTPRVWGLLDLILVAAAVIVAQMVGIKLWAAANGLGLDQLRKEADFPLSAMAVGSLSYLVVLALAIAWLKFRYHATLAHIGISADRLKQNLRTGLAAAILSLPVVYTIMAIVSASFDQQYDHPLLERMAEEGSLGAYLLATFCAVIAAPITEEFLFRVLLQGWLESIPWRRHLEWFTGALEPAGTIALPLSGTDRDAAELAGGVSDEAADAAQAEGAAANPYTPPLWPVFVSGTLFGLAHWEYGLSFVPLIVLGIILGLLYRAKHSIWPSFVVHFALNLITMLQLGLSMLVQAAAG